MKKLTLLPLIALPQTASAHVVAGNLPHAHDGGASWLAAALALVAVAGIAWIRTARG